MINVELSIPTLPKSEKQKLYIVPQSVFPLKCTLGMCILALVLGIASKQFEIFGDRSLTEMCALITMEVQAFSLWKN